MLSITEWHKATDSEKAQCLSRPVQAPSRHNVVLDIIKQVRSQGDRALFEFTEQFDKAKLTSLHVSKEQIQNATISQDSLNAINTAIQTISSYHKAMLPESIQVSTIDGITIRTEYRPIQRIGLYVPGGNNTPLISSVLMQAIPAQIAGCPIQVLCTPPDSTGAINAALLVAARLCGIERIYSIGGAQAIAAMAYGTESVPKVDKIFGPGNSFVTEAKGLVANDPNGAAIDMPAGPSEVMIIADATANPAFVAADLLAQAEHGVDSQVLLICDCLNFAEQVNQELQIQASRLSRQDIISQSLSASKIIICTSKDEQISIINNYAPEHLIINREDGDSWVSRINAVGTIFLGPWAAETLGDYVTGSNHVLPTNGFAKSYSGLSTVDFLTRFSVQSINQQGIQSLGPTAMTLALIEGLDAHANAVGIRLKALEV